MNNNETNIKESIKAKTTQYITAAFGLVAGLAWNDAIKELITLLVPAGTSTLWAKFLYALVLTIILVVVSIYLTRALALLERNEEVGETD